MKTTLKRSIEDLKPRVRLRRGTIWISLAAILATLSTTGTALGWGRIGHRTSSRLCETLLTPATKAAIRDLLEPGESLADASLWADEVRPKRRETAPWHYVNVPITDAKYDAKYCASRRKGAS